jgi:hypothetical protein
VSQVNVISPKIEEFRGLYESLTRQPAPPPRTPAAA